MIKPFILIISLFVAIQSKAQLEVPPQWVFLTLTTPHFEIIHNAGQQGLANLYAAKLEQSYEKLKTSFSVAPEKTIVVINDKTDITNGYATRIPYPHIMAYPVLPNSQDSLADSDDWALEFLGHEYTHILNFEPALGVMSPLRNIFGTALAPNLLLPTWWKEGLAVHMETTLSSGGRLRSPFQDSLLRSWVISNKLFSFDMSSANENLPDWPRGMTPYIFGSLFWAHTTSEYGNQIVDTLNKRHGGRVPYFIEGPAIDHLGVDYSSQYYKALKMTYDRVQKQLETLNNELPTVSTVIASEHQYSSSPSISSKGDLLALIGVNNKDKRKIYLYNRNEQGSFGNTDPILVVDEDAQNISWFNLSNRIIFDKVKMINRYENRSDLWIYDIDKKKSERLTLGARAREASVSPNDKNVVFIQLKGGVTDLVILDLETKNSRTLYHGELMEKLSAPRFTSEDEIIFSSRRINQKDRLVKISMTQPIPEDFLTSYNNARSPRKNSSGILFSSTKNGVNNIYFVKNGSGTANPITHTLTGISSFSEDPQNQDIYATFMTSNGPQVQRIAKNELRNTTPEIPSVSALFADLYPVATPESKLNQSFDESKLIQTPYAPLSYLLPRYWIPFISGSSNGGVILQASTSAFDPLKKHSYIINANLDTGTNQTSFLGQYINQTTQMPFIISSGRTASYLGTKDNPIIDNTLSAGVLPDTFELSENSSAQLGWQYIERNSSTTIRRAGPFVLLSYQSMSQGSHEIAPTASKSGYIGVTSYLPGDRTYISHTRYLLGGSLYTDRFLPERHALALKLNAVHTPEIISATYGVQTDSVFLFQTSNLPTYVMRGYAPGQFFGKNLAVINSDYQFPLSDIYKGSGTDPYFIRRISAALTMDIAALEGFVASSLEKKYTATSLSKQYFSYGAELRADTTIGYLLPIKFVLGYYLTPNSPEKITGSTAFSLQITGF